MKDLGSGLIAKGDGLSYENIYLSVSDGKTELTTFIYGEQFIANFKNLAVMYMKKEIKKAG
jgi:hypothetical protein